MSVEQHSNRQLVPAAEPVRAIERRRRMLPVPFAPAPVAVAAGGVVVSATVVALARAFLSRRRIRLQRKRRREVQRKVLGTRSFLIDVHLLGR